MDFLSHLFAPFKEFLFMRRALVACIGIALSSAPLGVILIQRRMSLMGEALSHGILPGIAIAYLAVGMWLPGLSVGGILAGLTIAFLSNLAARKTILNEDASFSSFYIIALAIGVLILSTQGGNMNLLHLLFGNVLAVDSGSLIFISVISTFSLILLFLLYRPLIYDCFDPLFMKSLGLKSSLYNAIFLTLVVCNLVAACQALGTLMALGMMMVPAVTARLLLKRLFPMIIVSTLLAIFSSYVGLLLSYYLNWPSGPTIILVAGTLYAMSLVKVLLKAHH